MYNLQGLISRSINNATMQFEQLGYISTNTSNANTTGYKNVRFENYLKHDGRLEGYVRSDFRSGAFKKTGNELDIAVDGPGFIPVTKKDGTVVYTRNGALSLNNERYLVTGDGDLIGDGIKLPPNYYRLTIKEDGNVAVRIEKDSDDKILGKVTLVNFNNPEGLELLDGNNLKETQESGQPYILKDHKSIKQGGLENSNVDMYYAVNEVLKINAGLISSTRMLKLMDEIYRQSINLRQ